jgi:hypothetical protein
LLEMGSHQLSAQGGLELGCSDLSLPSSYSSMHGPPVPGPPWTLYPGFLTPHLRNDAFGGSN